MRAKKVYEFVRGKDPKTSLGLGIINYRNFNSVDQFMQWLIQMLPIILDVKEIPKDIIYKWSFSTFYDIRAKYMAKIFNFIYDNFEYDDYFIYIPPESLKIAHNVLKATLPNKINEFLNNE